MQIKLDKKFRAPAPDLLDDNRPKVQPAVLVHILGLAVLTILGALAVAAAKAGRLGWP